METPIIIYLIQYNHDTSDLSWCEDPAPEQGMDKKDAISYVRSDHVLETLQEYKKVTDLIEELTPDNEQALMPWEKPDDKLKPIIGMMKAISEQAEDTIWYNDGTTVFERLWSLYLECAGEESDLIKKFPECQ